MNRVGFEEDTHPGIILVKLHRGARASEATEMWEEKSFIDRGEETLCSFIKLLTQKQR